MSTAPKLLLLATRLGPAKKADRLRYVLNDGTSCEIDMPRQRILPHDLVHYVVESRLRLPNGFLSLVAGGADALYVMEDRNYRSHEAVQAEAVVEALQTQLWNGRFETEAFLYGVETASAARGLPPVELPRDGLEQLLYAPALELQGRWEAVPAHSSLTLEFSPP